MRLSDSVLSIAHMYYTQFILKKSGDNQTNGIIKWNSIYLESRVLNMIFQTISQMYKIHFRNKTNDLETVQ